MGFGRGAIDQVHVAGCGFNQGRKKALPKATPGPAMKAIIDRGRRSVARRAIPPTTAGFQHVHNAADDPPIVYAPSAWTIAGQKRVNGRPLMIREPK